MPELASSSKGGAGYSVCSVGYVVRMVFNLLLPNLGWLFIPQIFTVLHRNSSVISLLSLMHRDNELILTMTATFGQISLA
jgi:hypothetical protein